nr:hypothetical protein [Alphaproteobacteria bacterium]
HEAFRNQRLRLTAVGQEVVAGECDAFGIMVRDWWLGGVHLKSGEPMWTWDADGQSLRIRKP